ncbi:MAG: TIGR04086 family membrane protein [Clostridia bacterium]|nr:TIGR04086 family membrane protein [Clostridia bacterium]
MSENLPLSEGLQISYVWKGLRRSITITIILGIIASILFQYTPLSERLLPSLSTFVYFISMFFGATLAARTAGRKGVIYGIIVSFLYFLIILFICLFVDHSLITLALFFKKLAIATISGVLGGIIGVGMSS